jgi:hypothetical protein
VGYTTPELDIEANRELLVEEGLEGRAGRQESRTQPLGLPTVICQSFPKRLESLKKKAVDRQDDEPESTIAWRLGLVFSDEAIQDVREPSPDPVL